MNKISLKSKNNTIIIFLVMLILQISCLIYFGTLKEGYHMDEIYSYSLSNSYYKPFLSDRDQWLGNHYFDDYIQVGNNDAFKYGSVYYNQTKDVHPPLFYFILHTICSFFPNTFSKWFGISLNIVFYIGTIVTLFFLARKLLKNDYLAILVCTLYGFSIGAISMVMFIRMYGMFTFWVVLQSFLFVKLLEKSSAPPNSKNKLYLTLFFVTFLGLFTQYYFLIFTFFISAVYFIYMLIKKKYPDLIKFSLSILFSIATAIALFPDSINHIFRGYRCTEAISKAKISSGYLPRIYKHFKIINNQLFAGFLIAFVIIILGIIIIRALLGKNCKLNDDIIKPLIILIPSVMYFLVVAKIAPYITDRYIAPIYPSLILMFIYILKYVLDLYGNKKVTSIATCLISLAILVTGFSTKNVDYLYKGYNKTLAIAQNYSNNRCLVFNSASWKIIHNSLEFGSFDNVYITNPDYSKYISDDYINNSNGMVLYIEHSKNKDEALNYAKKITNLNNYKYLYNSVFFSVYYLD